MRTFIRVITFCAIFILISIELSAQSKVGTTGAQFLKIGVGPRASSLGNAFVALADDATALYWNPAGISRINMNSVYVNHTEWLAGISHNYGAVVISLPGYGTVGASFTSLNMEEMKVRTEEQPDGTGEWFDASGIAMCCSYARNLTDRFSIGFNAKYIREQIWHMSANSFAIDVGTLFRTRFKDMKIGMCISNFGGNMQLKGRDALINYDADLYVSGNNDNINAHLDTEGWSLPLIFRVGVALDVINNPFMRVTTAIDAVHPNDVDEYLNIGTEVVWNEMIALRAGIRHLGNDIFSGKTIKFLGSGNFTLGAGLNYPLYNTLKIGVDWAFADYGRLEKTQRFSLSIIF